MTLLDTAGLREASDVVEQVGVQRAARAAADADVVALVFDAQVRHQHGCEIEVWNGLGALGLWGVGWWGKDLMLCCIRC